MTELVTGNHLIKIRFLREHLKDCLCSGKLDIENATQFFIVLQSSLLSLCAIYYCVDTGQQVSWYIIRLGMLFSDFVPVLANLLHEHSVWKALLEQQIILMLLVDVAPHPSKTAIPGLAETKRG